MINLNINQTNSPSKETSLSKNNPSNQIIISEQHIHLTDIEKKKYYFSICLKENSISFFAKDANDISGRVYELELSLEDFYKNDRYFRMFNDLQEIYDFFIENSQSSIKIQTENQSLIIKIEVEIIQKIRKIIFILLPKDSTIEQITHNLCEKIREIDELKLNIEILKESSEFYMYNLALGVDKNSFQKIYQELKNKSEIILNEKELKLIMSGIKNNIRLGFKEIKKLFDTEIDGDSAKKFHEKCDGQGNTLTLIYSNSGRRFGGFVSASWHKNKKYSSDKRAFLFSLDDKVIYYIKDDCANYALWGGPEYGPCFGFGCDLLVSDECKNNKKSYDSHEVGHEYSYDTNGKKFVYNGERFFQVIKYEVYQLIFS